MRLNGVQFRNLVSKYKIHCLTVCNFIKCHVIANAETVITADQVVRGGKTSDLKTMVDKAVSQSPCVKRVFVASRTGADVPMGKIDIPLEKVACSVVTQVFCHTS